MHGRHDPILVVLSVLIACLAGYVALDLAGRVAAARGSPRVRAGWLTGGALAMGIGIWDMHFLGMLAFGLHAGGATVPIAYDVPLVALSAAVAVVASALALAAVGRERLAPTTLGAAALLMGAAIAGMHYIGMAGMRAPGRVSYSAPLVAASVAIAIVASGVALSLAFRLRADESGRGHRRRAAAAALIGVAIAGMHYTAMAAARFAPPAGGDAATVAAIPAGSILATTGLAWSVGGATLVILVLALLGSALDRWLRARVAHAVELRRLYEVAESARVDAERAQELLQEQAAEMEQQVEEAQALAEELEQTNEELHRAAAAADRAAARTARLQAVTTALSATLTPAEVARVVVEHGLVALQARAGSVATVDTAAGELTLIGAFGYREHDLDPLGRVALDADFPLAEAVRSGAPILLASAEERAARYPRLAALLPAEGTGAMAAVPLTIDGRTVGALGIDFPADHVPTDDERLLLLAFAQQCAQALERARLFEAEAASRREAQSAERRLAFLADAGAALAGMLDHEATLAQTARLAVPAIADYCVVDLLDDDGRLRRLAEAHVDPAHEAILRGTHRYYPAASDDTHPLRLALLANKPRLVAAVSEAWIASTARDPAHLADVRTLGPRSIMMVPLSVPERAAGGDRAYGLVTLVATAASGRRFGPADLALAAEFGRRAALAIEAARSFEAERRALAAAERANQAKSDFLAVMSHELRTPLNAVIGYAELMALGIDGPVTEAQAGRLARIQASGTHLRDLVNEVLDLAQIESGELALRLETAHAVPTAEAALELIAPQAALRGVDLGVACDGERQAHYLGDPQRVRQIVVNLLANAVRFTAPGGRVRVHCFADTSPEPVPDRLALEPGPWLRLVVEDSGIGIAAEHLEAIFEPFVQIESGLTRTRGGTGLGLAISRRLARAMGGELVAASEPGVGSRFTLWLRAARADGAAVA